MFDNERLNELKEFFIHATTGFHFVHSEPIKESIWEEMNVDIFKRMNIPIFYISNGSHKPGADIICELGSFSNKTCSYTNKKRDILNISSFRLTSVCNSKEIGSVDEIKEKIKSLCNYEYYSILSRFEDDDFYYYDWFLIPSNLPCFNISNYEFIPMFSKSGSQTGWKFMNDEGCTMTITFSMSSQLWMKIKLTPDLKQYIIASSKCKKEKKVDYIDVYLHFNS